MAVGPMTPQDLGLQHRRLVELPAQPSPRAVLWVQRGRTVVRWPRRRLVSASELRDAVHNKEGIDGATPARPKRHWHSDGARHPPVKAPFQVSHDRALRCAEEEPPFMRVPIKVHPEDDAPFRQPPVERVEDRE